SACSATSATTPGTRPRRRPRPRRRRRAWPSPPPPAAARSPGSTPARCGLTPRRWLCPRSSARRSSRRALLLVGGYRRSTGQVVTLAAPGFLVGSAGLPGRLECGGLGDRHVPPRVAVGRRHHRV